MLFDNIVLIWQALFFTTFSTVTRFVIDRNLMLRIRIGDKQKENDIRNT